LHGPCIDILCLSAYLEGLVGLINAQTLDRLLYHANRSPVERERLGLVDLEPLLALPSPLQASHAAVVARRLPPSWNRNVNLAR
jgi:hypothetical protein